MNQLAQRDFLRFAAFIHGTAGIKMPPSKRTMVEGRLRRRLRALGMDSFEDYSRFVFDDGGLEVEAEAIIDALTTNKTEFFREIEHFHHLAATVLPAHGLDRPFKVWSAACSNGAEPYTLAMVLSEHARAVHAFRAQVYATDICTEVLEKAMLAVYPEAWIAPVPVELRKRYLLRSRDRSRAEVRIGPELRRMVRFGRLNLMDHEYGLDRDMDAIFCRNLLIYFDKATQQKVLGRLCDHLRPGGVLYLGHSETIAGLDLPLKAIGTTVFRRD